MRTNKVCVCKACEMYRKTYGKDIEFNNDRID